MKCAYIFNAKTGLNLVDCESKDWNPIKLSIRQVQLNRYGYDKSGMYFGNGQKLYHIHGENDDFYYIDEYVRAIDRNHACNQVFDKYRLAVKFKS